MISLEQVRQLDIRVKKAVTTVKALSAENEALKKRIAELEANLDDLQKEASDRKADEEQLEVSLQGVLDVLDEVHEETAGVEPEPPADNYVIETVKEEAPTDESDVDLDESPVDEAEMEAEVQSDLPSEDSPEIDSEGSPDDTPASEDDTPALEENAPALEEDAPAVDIVDDGDEENLDVTAFDGGDKSESENLDQSADEEINLEESGSDKESSDDDQFQSEFDIF